MANYKQRQAALKESIDHLNATFLVACQELETSVSEEEGASRSLMLLKKELKLARENLLKVRLRYNSGLIDYLDVLSALSAAQRLEQTEVQLRADLFLARTKMLLALGETCPKDK